VLLHRIEAVLAGIDAAAAGERPVPTLDGYDQLLEPGARARPTARRGRGARTGDRARHRARRGGEGVEHPLADRLDRIER